MTDKLDFETVGALIGKWIINSAGHKRLVVLDNKSLPLNNRAYRFLVMDEYAGTFRYSEDDIKGLWVEPKKKEKIAPYYYKNGSKIVISDTCVTERYANQLAYFISWCETLAIEIDEE